MAIAYEDGINGEPLTITIDAVAWAQPSATSWWNRCRALNRLLGKSTHLLHLRATDKTEHIWYAGVAGTSLAAGIERMAIAHDSLRESIVAFPLDTRIYVANLQKGLVREEWVLYPDAFDRHVQKWRAEGRRFALLTGGGRLQPSLPNAVQLPVDIDTNAMLFRHASLVLFSAGLLRWRDCVSAFVLVVLSIVVSFAFVWWDGTQSVQPLQKVAALVAEPVAPVRHTASAELAELALLVAEHDVALWRTHGATELSYDADKGVLELHTTSEAPVKTEIGRLSAAPHPVALKPYTLHSFQAQLAAHLASPAWTFTFGDPYSVGLGAELEQHVTVSIKHEVASRDVSVAAALVDLSERLVRLPITLYTANCKIFEGNVSACELSFAIRGLSA